MTKYEIAKRMDVSHQAVYLWFSGQTLPSTENLFRLAKLLEKTPEETMKLLTKKKPAKKKPQHNPSNSRNPAHTPKKPLKTNLLPFPS